MSCQCKTPADRLKCPNWIGPEEGFTVVNDATGEVQVISGCAPRLWLMYHGSTVKFMLSMVSAVESNRESLANGFANVASVIVRTLQPAVKSSWSIKGLLGGKKK